MNEDVAPPTITVGINGKTASANLPSAEESSTVTKHYDSYTDWFTTDYDSTKNMIISIQAYKSDTVLNLIINQWAEYPTYWTNCVGTYWGDNVLHAIRQAELLASRMEIYLENNDSLYISDSQFDRIDVISTTL